MSLAVLNPISVAISSYVGVQAIQVVVLCGLDEVPLR